MPTHAPARRRRRSSPRLPSPPRIAIRIGASRAGSDARASARRRRATSTARPVRNRSPSRSPDLRRHDDGECRPVPGSSASSSRTRLRRAPQAARWHPDRGNPGASQRHSAARRVDRSARSASLNAGRDATHGTPGASRARQKGSASSSASVASRSRRRASSTIPAGAPRAGPARSPSQRNAAKLTSRSSARRMRWMTMGRASAASAARPKVRRARSSGEPLVPARTEQPPQRRVERRVDT